jgi:hypothetical protein
LERKDTVFVKGKGMMNTYWIDIRRICATSDTNVEQLNQPCVKSRAKDISRMVEWNVDVFIRLLKQVFAHRSGASRSRFFIPDLLKVVNKNPPIEELTISIKLEDYDINSQMKFDENSIHLEPEVENQLRQFLKEIAGLYKDHPFHNFEHASHVVMSTTKLLSRLDTGLRSNKSRQSNNQWSKGRVLIDPLAKLAIAFSALIQDVDHPGVPNSQLIEEESLLAQQYNGKSVTEQNAVDKAWKLFAQPSFITLHKCIFTSEYDVKRFRQLVVNAVLATDIIDPELKEIRDYHWKRAFSISKVSTPQLQEKFRNHKAALVIEHIIQASDVCHYMQHWKIYEKWNELRFQEQYAAYKNGRLTTDPSSTWYDDELNFFDQYIIPLAKKLKLCADFGVTCDEFLDYAKDNRLEWETKGHEITKMFLEKLNCKTLSDDDNWYLSTSIHAGQSFL